MRKIPNPFPQVGAPGGKKISPVGYDLELEEIKELIKNNAGRQLIIINIIGEYGQGKTTIIEELREKFSKSEDEGGWGKLEVIYKDLDKIPDLADILQKAYNQAKQKESGILIFLDEAQKLIEKREGEESTLSDEEKKFLNDLRSLVDNKIEKIDSNKYFVLLLSLHPETFKYYFDVISGLTEDEKVSKRAREDVTERVVVKRYDLRDLDYFSAYEIIRRYMESEGYKIEDFFDESVINSIFAITPRVHEGRVGVNKKNPRTYVQIFF